MHVTDGPQDDPPPLGETVRMSLSVPAEHASLPEVRGAVRGALERSRWRDGRPGDVVLAVNEAVGNAIEHGSRPGEPVDVDIMVTRSAARVRVADRGRPGAHLPEGDPVAPPPECMRGRGRLIMERLTDEWETARTGDGTEVVLHFSASPA